MDQGPSGSTSQSQSQLQEWNIFDATLPQVSEFDAYEEWPNGHCKMVYSASCRDAKRHTSGWAMQYSNNHDARILKKSCLGVLVCSLRCVSPDGGEIHLRPASTSKARKKQIGKPCSNYWCSGRLEIMACQGDFGYPVTHYWRDCNNAIFFCSIGTHDHPRPENMSAAMDRRRVDQIALRLEREADILYPFFNTPPSPTTTRVSPFLVQAAHTSSGPETASPSTAFTTRTATSFPDPTRQLPSTRSPPPSDN